MRFNLFLNTQARNSVTNLRVFPKNKTLYAFFNGITQLKFLVRVTEANQIAHIVTMALEQGIFFSGKYLKRVQFG